MNRIIVWCITAAVAMSAGHSDAITRFSQNGFKTAESLDPGMTQSGIHFTLGDHYRSYYPEIRYGLGALMEIGVKFGATSARDEGNDKLGALVGVDLKYQLVREADGVPIDLAVDLGFDTTIINSKNASELSFATIISKNFPLTDRGYKIVPYGGLEMASLRGSQVTEHGTSMYVLGGLVWKLSQKFMLLLEVKSGPSTVGGAGIRFEY